MTAAAEQDLRILVAGTTAILNSSSRGFEPLARLELLLDKI
ncbi:hypothetical protein [Parafrankia sp. EUN1f]|nr:hypothetical protein [Parafrankia sp. EUN1f]EFC83039.1 hypothetical protein FrEUN1fDRAFT_3801 [Parafrankia sp. EUN1f]